MWRSARGVDAILTKFVTETECKKNIFPYVFAYNFKSNHRTRSHDYKKLIHSYQYRTIHDVYHTIWVTTDTCWQPISYKIQYQTILSMSCDNLCMVRYSLFKSTCWILSLLCCIQLGWKVEPNARYNVHHLKSLN